MKELLKKVVAITNGCAEIIKKNWNRPHKVEYKGAVDLVTETDLESQAFLEKELKQLLPDAAFIGEEGKSQNEMPNGLAWVVDPVDGTTNFVHRIPFVSVSVALCENGKPIIGVVNAPVLLECFYAAKNTGAFLNGSLIHVSDVRNLKKSLAVTGFPYEMESSLPAILKRLERILPNTQGLRRLGSAALDLAYVACGRIEAFYEAGLKPWDMAAGWLLVEEAGGRVSDFEMGNYSFYSHLLATNGHIHEDFSKLLTDK